MKNNTLYCNRTAPKSHSMRWKTLAVIIMVAFLITPTAQAQYNGHNALGDFGLMSGSQPGPGFYATGFYYHYSADKVINRNGDRITFSPDQPGDIAVDASVALAWYVSNKKLFGANYSIMGYVQLVDVALEVPIAGLQSETGMTFGDLYLQPLNLGWHTRRADYTVGLGFYAPTGSYELGGDDNVGLGMWTFELQAGATVFFDEAKSWHFATTAFYETHTEKKDSDIRVGDLLTLEGGFGKSFLEGALSVGAAYYAQWKLSDDDFGLNLQLPGGSIIGKHRVFGVGPDVTIPVPIKNKLVALVNVRYLWEFGARTKTEGNTFVVTATFPIPSIPIN